MRNVIGNQPDVADITSQAGFDAAGLELPDPAENIDEELPYSEAKTPRVPDSDAASKIPDAPSAK